MELVLPLLTLAGIHLLACMSPGQSFIVTAQMALAHGRAPAIANAFGQGLGAVLWAASAMLGLAIILAEAAWLYTALRVAGGLYLLYLAARIWLNAGAEVEVAAEKGENSMTVPTGFRIGFLTLIANPKAIIFFSSIFVALLPPTMPTWVKAAIILIVFCNEVVWYSLVTMLFSSAGPRGVYLRYKPWLDRMMAVALALLGVRLVAGARS
jgi:threonine/homoserine/homoserine lactone efflux protein